MMVYDSDSTHLCSCFRFKLPGNLIFSRDSHGDRHKNVIQYEIKALCPHALGTKSRLN